LTGAERSSFRRKHESTDAALRRAARIARIASPQRSKEPGHTGGGAAAGGGEWRRRRVSENRTQRRCAPGGGELQQIPGEGSVAVEANGMARRDFKEAK